MLVGWSSMGPPSTKSNGDLSCGNSLSLSRFCNLPQYYWIRVPTISTASISTWPPNLDLYDSTSEPAERNPFPFLLPFDLSLMITFVDVNSKLSPSIHLSASIFHLFLFSCCFLGASYFLVFFPSPSARLKSYPLPSSPYCLQLRMF